MKNSSDDGSSVPLVLNDPTDQISRECFANNGLARREFFSLLIGGLGTTALVGHQSIGPSSTIETNMEDVQFGISPVIDLAVAGASAGKTFNEFQAFIEGSLNAGIHVLCVPMAEIDNFEATARNIITLYGRIAQIQGKTLIIRKPSDIKKSILEKKVGIIPTFRGMEMIVEKLDPLNVSTALSTDFFALSGFFRSILIEPAASIAQPNTGILNNSFFARNIILQGRQAMLNNISRALS